MTTQTTTKQAAIDAALKAVANALEVIKNSDKTYETYTDIKTFEDACALFPPTENQKIILDYGGVDDEIIAAKALLKLSIIRRAMNYLNNGKKEWTPDWTNSNEYKYYAWLKFVSGSGFSRDDYDCVSALTLVGSRLCFMTSDMALYASEQFNSLYNDLFTL